MKKNKLTIILIIIIILLSSYIVYDKIKDKDQTNINLKEQKEVDEVVSILDTIKLDYVTIYLADDGNAYIVPIKGEEIENLNIGDNLKSRLNLLYDRAFYYDIYLDNYKIKGYRVHLDEDIEKIGSVDILDNTYIIFIKENHTIGLFNYLNYCNALDTKVIDNYKKLKNVTDVKDNKIIYLDGNKEILKIEE